MLQKTNSKVFIRINENNEIVAVNSSDFIDLTNDWIEIDEGYGDKYHHAQNNYFNNTLRTIDGVYRYKYIDNSIIEKDNLEISAGTAEIKRKENVSQRISELKQMLSEYDYIGVKIATGRATIDEYSKQINQMTEWANEINALESEQ